MKIKASQVRSKIPDEDLKGLTLSFFSACIKANKSNKPAPITHFFRERLGRRADRAALNTVLNTLSQAIGGDVRQKEVGSILTRKASRSPLRVTPYSGKSRGLPKPKDGFVYAVNGLDPHSRVLEVPSAVMIHLSHESGDHLDSWLELGYSPYAFSRNQLPGKVVVDDDKTWAPNWGEKMKERALRRLNHQENQN